MKNAIGLIELKSIPVGIQAADEMLKAADVEILLATPICPGKYVIIITGNVGAVESSMKVGASIGGIFVVENSIINNVNKKVLPAISGLTNVEKVDSIGTLETISALTCVVAADIIVKAANVELIEVRIARGLGGKGFVVFTGEVSSVRSAMKAATDELKASGSITSSTVIASPHKNLVKYLY